MRGFVCCSQVWRHLLEHGTDTANLLLLPLLLSTLRFATVFPAAQVTFTKDRELVCRHAQCDLHTTTNILVSVRSEKNKIFGS